MDYEKDKFNDKRSKELNNYFKELNINETAKKEFKRLPDYKTHSLRVTKLAEKTGQKLNYSKKELRSLKKAALFHDIGKNRFEDWIFENEGDLTPEQRKKHINPHAKDTEKILTNKLDGFTEKEIKMAAQHHEHLDGIGYPRGLKGEQILEEGKVLKCCDTFEAIIADRTHNPARSYSKTKDIMNNTLKGKLDPDISEVVLESGKELLVEDLRLECKDKNIDLSGLNKDDLIEIYDKNLISDDNLKEIVEGKVKDKREKLVNLKDELKDQKGKLDQKITDIDKLLNKLKKKSKNITKER